MFKEHYLFETEEGTFYTNYRGVEGKKYASLQEAFDSIE
jgi:hypothetical protein